MWNSNVKPPINIIIYKVVFVVITTVIYSSTIITDSTSTFFFKSEKKKIRKNLLICLLRWLFSFWFHWSFFEIRNKGLNYWPLTNYTNRTSVFFNRETPQSTYNLDPLYKIKKKSKKLRNRNLYYSVIIFFTAKYLYFLLKY